MCLAIHCMQARALHAVWSRASLPDSTVASGPLVLSYGFFMLPGAIVHSILPAHSAIVATSWSPNLKKKTRTDRQEKETPYSAFENRHPFCWE